MFTEKHETASFTWDLLGDIETGRPNLGMSCPVLVYRLFKQNMTAELIRQFGRDKAIKLIKNAGYHAGRECCNAVFDCDLPPQMFMISLQMMFKENNIAIINFEKADFDNWQLVIAVNEGLECSGIAPMGHPGCFYLEGFFGGILETYAGRKFIIKEIDCWAAGQRVCRFTVEPSTEGHDYLDLIS
ncbi:MAG: 4-vinyl reductase [Phycisphaerae bacterium]|nr:4-vinyl reductase [Phycisphaerae bacterium]